MTMAFADAGIDPSEIGYINAHGTSTPLGDTSETRVIKLASARRTRARSRSPRRREQPATASEPPARSRRSSRSSRRSAASCRRRSTTRTEDPTCDLDYIPNEARERDDQVGVSNSFGFGGHNACMCSARSTIIARLLI
jgi:3-oxoacyl-[acyl-carrier-protein] synthase II